MDDLIRSILSSRKYRGLGIPEETLRDLVEQERGRNRSAKELEQAVREKLHNIVAPYLGDPDYVTAGARLEAAFASDKPEQVKTVCRDLLAAHASTCERLPAMAEFYPRLFALTGCIRSVCPGWGFRPGSAMRPMTCTNHGSS
jgi:16S rRNA (guanine(1405)-N(7))-methyltransferase